MADRLTIVCRDCGEVTHVALAGLKPGAMVSCTACGLVHDPSHMRPPPSLGFGASIQARRAARAGLRR